MEELSVASSFMSNLKDENIKLSMNLTEHNEKIEDLSDKVYKEIEIVLEFMQKLDNSKESIEKLQEENADYQASLETKRMRPVKELANVATKLETLEDLVQNLQDIIADITNYLGSKVSNDASLSREIDNHLTKASSAFGRHRLRVWRKRSHHNFTLTGIEEANKP
uniref:Uncharacterized protein n=1 Tax=Biomphalaria glabrata TaxID=6526 RepID=A0A2C9LSU8_BIOGL